LERDCFFTWHIVLVVGESQDLPSKIWQPLENALTKVQKGKFIWLHVLNNAMSPLAQSNSHKTKYDVLPPSLFIYRYWCSCHKFDSIYRKCVQHLYLQINLFKN
jgi:hypothetical protein